MRSSSILTFLCFGIFSSLLFSFIVMLNVPELGIYFRVFYVCTVVMMVCNVCVMEKCGPAELFYPTLFPL